MGMNTDLILVNEAIKKLRELLLKIPQEGREELTNDIIGFIQRMKDRYDNEIKEDE